MSRGRALQVWLDRAVNLGLLWSGSLLTGSGLAMKYRVGYEAPRGATVWGMDGEGWAKLHWVLSLVVLGLLTLHLIRHARWLWAVLVSRVTPAMLMVVLIGVFLAAAPVLWFGK